MLRIIDHGPEHQQAVAAFNDRMGAQGSQWAFYVHPQPLWLPSLARETSVWRQYYLAVENGGIVRGGYCLKRQQFWMAGETRRLTSFQGPVSEGSVDPRYAAVAIAILREMLKQEPELYAWGPNPKLTALLAAGGWRLVKAPLCLKVVRPYRFLRLNRLLRVSLGRRVALDTLAFSGLGWLAIQAMNRRQRRPSAASAGLTWEVVPRYGDWMTQLFEAAKSRYRAVAVRDEEAMNRLLPGGEWPPAIRLQVCLNERVAGSAAILDTRMQDDPRFGSLRVGTVVDSFAAPEHAPNVVQAATAELERRGVDLVISNQTHPAWIAAFAANGFHVLSDRRVLAISKTLEQQWNLQTNGLDGIHLTTLDGEGPVGLAPAKAPQAAAPS